MIPVIGAYVQDTLGHWYQVLEVQAEGWRYTVDPVYVSHNSETGAIRFNSYGWGHVVIGRSELRIQ